MNMKSIGSLKINTILELMLTVAVATMVLTSGFVWIITERIIDVHEAKLFLSGAMNIPGNTLYIYSYFIYMYYSNFQHKKL